jgi:hypothetical protein
MWQHHQEFTLVSLYKIAYEHHLLLKYIVTIQCTKVF